MDVTNYEAQIMNWFHYFHKNPEVSWKEFETTSAIAAILNNLGVTYHCFSDITGLVAEIGSGSEVIAVRADIDALWQEVNGVMKANHSCGHDANMSIVLGALLHLKDKPLSKRVRFIFQPAEEKGDGALAMVNRGVMEDVTHLFGIHLRPAEELPYGKFAPSVHHGACSFLEGKIFGEDAHGARPHQGKSAIDVIATLYGFVNSIRIDPKKSYSVKLTKISAGGKSLNIIPGTATFAIDVRAQSNEVLKSVIYKLEKGLDGISQTYNVNIDYKWTGYTPAARVSRESERIAKVAIVQNVGEEGLFHAVTTPGSDDFHFYTIKHPNVKATMIGIGADLLPGLHHPDMTFNYDVLDKSAKILADAIYLATENSTAP